MSLFLHKNCAPRKEYRLFCCYKEHDCWLGGNAKKHGGINVCYA